ncbi:lysophospholipid acyltransferase family protein [bacterium]
MRFISKRLQHYFEYFLLKFLEYIFNLFPILWSYKFIKFLGLAIYYFFPIRKMTAYYNLKRVFPNKDDKTIYSIIKNMYVNFSYFILESIIMQKLRRTLHKNVDVLGLENLQQAVSQNKGVVLYTAHLGNWHIMGQKLVDMGFVVNNIVKKQRNSLVFDEEVAAMKKVGMKTTILQKTPKNIFKAFKDKDIVEFLADQDAGDDGIFIDFFGTKASTATGPALFSLKLGAPMIFAIDVRQGLFKHKIFLETIKFDSKGDLNADIMDLTHLLTKKLEQYIMDYPDQYFWLHKRWLTREK